MRKVNLYSDKNTAVAIEFTVLGNKVRVGAWKWFPWRRPIVLRTSKNLSTRGWQLDFFWLSIAVLLGANTKEVTS